MGAEFIPKFLRQLLDFGGSRTTQALEGRFLRSNGTAWMASTLTTDDLPQSLKAEELLSQDAVRLLLLDDASGAGAGYITISNGSTEDGSPSIASSLGNLVLLAPGVVTANGAEVVRTGAAASGAITLLAGGTNQHVNLRPSGTGRVIFGAGSGTGSDASAFTIGNPFDAFGISVTRGDGNLFKPLLAGQLLADSGFYGYNGAYWFVATTAGIKVGNGQSIAFSSTSSASGATGVQWQVGTGSPEGVVTAAVGSFYSRTNGGAGTTLYVKESGSGNTGWAAK